MTLPPVLSAIDWLNDLIAIPGERVIDRTTKQTVLTMSDWLTLIYKYELFCLSWLCAIDWKAFPPITLVCHCLKKLPPMSSFEWLPVWTSQSGVKMTASFISLSDIVSVWVLMISLFQLFNYSTIQLFNYCLRMKRTMSAIE